MIVECSYCELIVDAKIVGKHEAFDPRQDPAPFLSYLLECPKCNNTLLAGHYEGENDLVTRLWPDPTMTVSMSIPDIIRSSIQEAIKCYKAGAYSACAVMCGRALEGLCRHYTTKAQHLSGGLRELLDRGVIDKRLFQWAEELKEARNISAHATGTRVSKEDARDLLDFVNAICEYVFVLTERFDRFMKRKNSLPPKKKSAGK